MKAITIHQPWASLIAIGAKRFETRGWKTNYRGPIAIHASKKEPMVSLRSLPAIIQKSMFDCFYENFGIHAGAIKRMPTGAIVAVANLEGCYRIYDTIDNGKHIVRCPDDKYDFDKVKYIRKPESDFGYFEEGRFAWEISDVQLIEPVPAKGQQGLWNWNELAS